MNRSHHIKNNRRGFSLLEILIVVAIAVSVVIVVGNIGGNVNLLNGFVSQQLQSKSDIDQSLQVMAGEIRSAGLSASGAYPIDSASTSSFAFYSDIYKNGIPEHVRYFLASSTLYKGVIEPTGTPIFYPTSTEVVTDVIDNIIPSSTSTPLFSYYDATYTGTQPPLPSSTPIASVRLVNISFGADVQPKQAPGPEYFSLLVDIRNLRSN
jgi:prepilin-type N-terminal cleavage/methylation domain-containing protein